MGKRKNRRIKIRFWHRGNNHNIDVPNHKSVVDVLPNTVIVPSTKAFIYVSELQYIARCIQDYPNIETGGQLFGAWTASGAPRVMYVIGPGQRANHEVTFFNQDIQYLETIGAKLKEFGLQHIGEWHSHHHLGLPNPSGHDVQTMQNGIVQLNLNRFLLCIGSYNERGIVINPFNFARDAHFIQSQWEVIDSRNRLREIIDHELANELFHPTSSGDTFAAEFIVPKKQSLSSQSGWFSVLENRQAFKQIIDKLKACDWVKNLTPQISSDGIVSLKIETRTFADVITFPADFPEKPFEIERMGFVEKNCNRFSFDNDWVNSLDLIQTFTDNYFKYLKNHF